MHVMLACRHPISISLRLVAVRDAQSRCGFQRQLMLVLAHLALLSLLVIFWDVGCNL